MSTQQFEQLRERYGSHSEVARRMGLHPVYWREVRRKVVKENKEPSRFVNILIEQLLSEPDNGQQVKN